MRLPPLALAAALLISGPAHAQQQAKPGDGFNTLEMRAAMADPAFFTVDPASIEIVPLGPVSPQSIKPGDPQVSIPKPPGTTGGTPVPVPPVGGGPIGGPIGGGTGQDPLVLIDRIVNLAHKIWKIIEENKPVVNTNITYANAVPEGITSWTQLAQWKPPESTMYGFYAKNAYGVRVIDVKYVVFRTCGGNYKGKGKFLTGVTVEPTSISVAWGYKFSMDANVPSVANVGTTEDPIASMMAKLNWKIDTAIKHEQGTSIYYVQGDSVFRELAGPFTSKERQTLREKLPEAPMHKPGMPALASPEMLKSKAVVGF